MPAPRRVVSLVPSLTATAAALGAGGRLVGVTRYCTTGAPAAAALVGGTKNPDLQAVAALAPDLVLANTEENRPEDLAALRAAGLVVEETYPRTVAATAAMVRRLGQVLAVPTAAAALADRIDAARAAALAAAPSPRVMALVLVWRRPWRAVGPGTYVDDLLWTCGFGNVLAGWEDPYPQLAPGLHLGADVVLLPSEPYAFSPADLPAVGDLVGDVPIRFVDGELLTWHGERTPSALAALSALAAEHG